MVYVSLKRKTHREPQAPGRVAESSGAIASLLSAAAVSKLRDMLSVDYALYHHFNRSFWGRIAIEPGFDAEVAELRLKVAKLEAWCAQRSEPGGTDLCSLTRWENVKFGCELAKLSGMLPKERVCKDCAGMYINTVYSNWHRNRTIGSRTIEKY